MGRPYGGLQGAKALSGRWEGSVPGLILAHRRSGPQGCRYGGNRRRKDHSVGLGRGRWASLLHTADLSLGNRAWVASNEALGPPTAGNESGVTR